MNTILRGVVMSVLLTIAAATAPLGSASARIDQSDQPGEPIELGLGALQLTAPDVTGAGARPTFAWEPVVGATAYALVVLAADDAPIWAWQGAETTVVLGGWPATPSPEAPGPLLLGPGTWFAVALDGAGAPLANSVLRPVAP